MKEPVRSQKINQLIRVTRESIQAKLRDEKFCNRITEVRDALKAKDQQSDESKNLLRDIETLLSLKNSDSSILGPAL